ncbi:hypothetical protein ACFLR7_00235 [Acidobacteriota bacterium]
MRIVLLDADVIIDLHRLELWEHIVKRNEIIIPSSVLRREVYYFKDELGNKHRIDLLQDVGKTIREVSVKADEIHDFKQKFERFIKEELDLGETEALKILSDREDCLFCTCDKAAIKAIAIMGKREQGISFENLVTSSGFTKKLEKKHMEIKFKQLLDEGSLLRVQRFGLKE